MVNNTKLAAIVLLSALFLAACTPAAPAAQPTPPPPTPVTQAPAQPPVDSGTAPLPSAPPSTEPPPPPPPIVTPPPAPEIPEGVNLGNRAIDFTLETLAGDNITLSSLRGKTVLVNFWATWCGPCKIEMPYLQQVTDDWKDRGLVVLAVDLTGSTKTETPEAVQKFMTERNLSMTVPLDNGLKVAKTYGISAIPTTFIIDKDGVIRFKFLGSFPNVAAIETELARIIP